MRRGCGTFLLGAGTLIQVVFMFVLIAGAATGIWWPLTLAIIDNPVSLLWWIPLGFVFTSISFFIARFLYDLVIGWPLGLLTGWLLRDEI